MHEYSSINLAQRLYNSYVSQYRRSIAIAIFFMFIEAAANATLVWLIKPVLDDIFIAKDHTRLMIIPSLIIAIATVRAIADYIQKYTIDLVGQKIINNIQLDLYSHLVKADVSIITKQSSGYFISKFTNDVINIKNCMSLFIVSFARESITVLLLIGIMFYNQPILSAIAFFIFPLAIIPIIKLGKRMKGVMYTTQTQLEQYTSCLDEHFRNIRTIKAFCNEDIEINNVSKFLTNLLALYKKAIKLGALTSPIMEMLSSIAIAIIIFYGGYQVLAGITSPGSFFTFIVAFISAYKPLKSLASLNLTLQTGMASTSRIFNVLDHKNTVEIITDQHKEVKFSSPSITMKDVSFSYSKNRHAALSKINLTIKPNQYIAIVGESGSGKSTLVELLLKFYLPQEGQIFIDNKDIALVSSKSVRQYISIVTQDVLLFNNSIKNNILCGNQNLSDKQLLNIAKQSRIDDFIDQLPDKYNTEIGHSGINLSGGQRQKIAIARALVKDVPILIFDEATSALDTISEQHIKEFLNTVKNKKTVIIITHRLASIQDADNIFVMRNGKLVEEGTHKKLIDKKTEYYRLYKKKILI